MKLKSCILAASVFLISLSQVFGQQTIYDTIVHDGLNRAFILYVPTTYSASNAAPLVFNFHGYTSNSTEQMFYADFRPIADTAGFIIVHPMGTLDNNGTTHWNVGWETSTVDDIGFTETLLDTISKRYNIDSNRVYSTGMSNGGYISLLLACQLSERFAAVASVTGSMTTGTTTDCTPTHPIGVMQIHGTADPTVPYNGSFGTNTIPQVVNHWVNYNNCDTAIVVNVEDIDSTDGSTVEHYIYANGDNCVNAEHFKITNGAHRWPGQTLVTSGTNYDIDGATEVWRFFLQHKMSGRYMCDTTTAPTGLKNRSIQSKMKLDIYPNPSFGRFMVHLPTSLPMQRNSLSVVIYNSIGKQTDSFLVPHRNDDKVSVDVDASQLPKGLYFLQLQNKNGIVGNSKVLIK